MKLAAEMVKYASSTSLATKISSATEIANLGEWVAGTDVRRSRLVQDLTKGSKPALSMRERGLAIPVCAKMGKRCKFAEAYGYEAPLLRTVFAVNRAQPFQMAQLALSALKEPKGKKVAFLGFAFEPDADDLRGSLF